MPDLFIKNAQIATEEGVFEGGVLIVDEKIVQIVEGDVSINAAQVVDLGGKTRCFDRCGAGSRPGWEDALAWGCRRPRSL